MDRSHAIDRSEAKFPMQRLSGSSSRIVTRRGEERRGIDGQLQLVDEIHTHTYRLPSPVPTGPLPYRTINRSRRTIGTRGTSLP